MKYGRTLGSLALSAAIFSAPVTTALAQDDTTTLANVTLTGGGSEPAQFTATDVSLSVSEMSGYDGTPPSIDLSISLSGLAPVNATLLEWITMKAAKGKTPRNLTIEATSTDPDGTTRDITYEVGEARVTAFSSSHSGYSTASYLSVQIAAKTLSIDGVVMK